MLMLQDIKDRLAKLLVDLTDAQAQRYESFENEPFFQMLYGDLSARQFREDQKRLYSNREQQEETYRSWLREKCYQPLTDSFDEKKLESLQSEPFHSEKFFAMFAERHGELLVNRNYFTQEELDQNKAAIGKALMQVSMLFNDYMVEDETGNILGAQKILTDFLSTVSLKAPEPQAPKSERHPPKMLYSEAVEKYISAKLLEKAWKEKNVKDIKARLNNFIDINGDIPLEDVTRDDMRSFMSVLQKLPPNRSKSPKFKNKSIVELLAMEPKQTLNVATVNTILDAVGSLFEWYVREGKLRSNPVKGLQVKDTRLAIDLREAFSREDLELIFAHPKFTQGKFIHPAYFWVPLIALFTGMRREEIAQLHCTDVYQDKNSSLWVININDTGMDEAGFPKSLKNKNANRIVPVHQELITLGFLDYRAKIAKKKHIRLFPELKKTENTSQLGKQPGKQFSAVVNVALQNPGKKSLHSLRHTFADFFKVNGLQTDMFRQVYGHDNPELAVKQYGSRFPVKLLYEEVIEKLDYKLDLSALKNSKYI